MSLGAKTLQTNKCFCCMNALKTYIRTISIVESALNSVMRWPKYSFMLCSFLKHNKNIYN